MKKSHVGVPIGEAVEEYLVKPTFDEDGVQASSGIGLDGREYPDPVPMAPPVGYDAPPDIMQMIRSMVKSEQLRQRLEEEGFETFEEADDFELEDDPLDALTPYEKIFEVPTPVPEKPLISNVTEGKGGGGEGGASPEKAPPPPAVKVDNSTST